MKCFLCPNKDFLEKEIHESHDIPKYIGGTDKEGRHHLCKQHHTFYDTLLLKRFLKVVGIEWSEDYCWEEIAQLQKEISKLKQLHPKFREIAKKIKEVVFDGREI